MRTIREVAGSELVCASAGTETFELREPTRSSGGWRPRVTVRVPGSDDNIALFHPGWMSGGT